MQLTGLIFSIACWGTTLACSNFYMDTQDVDYRISGRTMDLSSGQFIIRTVPKGNTDNNRLAYVAFEADFADLDLHGVVTAGMNEMGLSCDMQVLDGTKYPARSPNGTNVMQAFFCGWVLANFDNIQQLREGMQGVTVWGPEILSQHFVARDSNGSSLVLEWVDEQLQMHDDHNDDGHTGFGIMTNEPVFEYHLTNVRHLQWKRKLTRQAVTIPGTWYPEERFMRLYMVKSAMLKPTSYQEAMMQATHVLNTVTVPMGEQYGTDTGAGSGEGKGGDHTLWGVLYDHKKADDGPVIYWRTMWNQSLQRLRLADLKLNTGAKSMVLPVENSLAWFVDAASSLKPTAE